MTKLCPSCKKKIHAKLLQCPFCRHKFEKVVEFSPRSSGGGGKNVVVVLVILALLGFGAYKFLFQSPGSGAPAEKKNLLWSVEGENNTVYIQGAINTMKESDYPVNPVIEKAYNDSQVIVVETDMSVVTNADMERIMVSKGLYKGGGMLRDDVSEDTFNKAMEVADDVGLPRHVAERWKPWFLSINLSLMKFRKLGYKTHLALPAYFTDRANKDGKEVLSLETLEYTSELFNDISRKTQEALLVKTIRELDAVEELTDRMVVAWKYGNVAELGDLTEKMFEGFPELYETIVVNRSERWVEQIEVFLEDDVNYFVIVGAGHLVGDLNLIELIGYTGFTPKQM